MYRIVVMSFMIEIPQLARRIDPCLETKDVRSLEQALQEEDQCPIYGIAYDGLEFG
jgi:hypothetical protein